MDYYKILGVDKTASQDEIKKAFRKLSLKNHPDKGGDATKFKEINEAYQTLGDKKTRQEYDMRGSMPRGMPFPPGMNMGGMGIPPEFLNMMFGQNAQRSGGPFNFSFTQSSNGTGSPNVHFFKNGVNVTPSMLQKPTPIIKSIEITLEQAFNGLKMPFEVERWVLESDVKRIEKETIYVDIPPGIDHNEIIVIENKGNVISDDNKGHIKLFVKVKNDTDYTRDGLNLILKKKITLKEALCGFVFEIKYFNGRKFNIRNEDNVIKPGYNKIVPNLGMKRDNHTGSLVIAFDIEFPDNYDSETTKKLSELL